MKIIARIMKVSSNQVDVWCIFMGETSVLPVCLLKILRKKVILILPGSLSKELDHDPNKMCVFQKRFSDLVLAISNEIVVYSHNLIKDWHLEKYEPKIIIAHRHIIDLHNFRYNEPFEKRENIIGYVGQFNSRKGVLTIIDAIPSILQQVEGIKFVFYGDGPLRDTISRQVRDMKINDWVDLPGWVDHKDLPKHLNTLKLLILPSYAEGLPNIMLEAMACGTPVLVTPVGAIPDYIIDRVNGYILKDTKIESIVIGITECLSDKNIIGVINNGKELIETTFTIESCVRRWKNILE